MGIWGVDSYQGSLSSGSCLVTCSSDETIRIWSLDHGPLSNSGLECHLQKIITVKNNDDIDPDKVGVKCVKVSPDECFLASGDRSGNIRVHNVKNFSEICKIEAHDAEIMSLRFGADRYLASASRDRLVHMFDVDNDFEFLTTVDEHSSVVTSVDFITSGEDDILVSSGADKSIISRKVIRDEGGVTVSRCSHIVCQTVPYDMVVSGSDDIMVACQDRAVRRYTSNSQNGKPKLMKGSASDDGSLYRMTVDKSGSYYATSCSDKTIGVFNCQTENMVGTLVGHSDPVTGLVFTHDCKYLVTVSGDSCIFVWKLPKKMASNMASKLNITFSESTICCPDDHNEEFGSPTKEFLNAPDSSPDPMYRFSVGKLPIWARKKVTTEVEYSRDSATDEIVIQSPRGKWATKNPDHDNDSENVLERFQNDEEPNIGSVDKTKKLLFQKEDDNEEFEVNAIDAETLRKSHKELSLPASSADTSVMANDDEEVENTENKAESAKKKSFLHLVQSLSIAEGGSIITRKQSSISNAWREGNTPVQKRKASTNDSIQKLITTNQLHTILKNDTPVKSPNISSTNLMKNIKDVVNKVIESPKAEKPKIVPEEVSSSAKKINSRTGNLTKDLIEESVSQVKEATDHLLVLFKRVSLDDDLDDNLRQELVSMMTSGAGDSLETLRLVQTQLGPGAPSVDTRSQEEIKAAALENISRFLSQNVRSETQVEAGSGSAVKKI